MGKTLLSARGANCLDQVSIPCYAGRIGEPEEGWPIFPDEKGEHAMDRSALRQVLREMIENNTGDPLEQFDDDTDLRTGLGLDSVDVVTLAMEIQDTLKVTIAAGDFEQLHTVRDLVEVIHSRLPATRQAA